MTFDPITLEIQWQRLVNIVDEIDNAVIRTSFSTIVGESHDFGCALMDAEGSGLAQAQWSPPQFCTMLPRTTKSMLKRFPPDTLKDGDVLATNDPWIGSTHLPDYNLVSPVFHKGRLVAFLGTVAHVSDVGGHLGDLEAQDMFMEGTRVMPNKFYSEGKVVPVIEEFISANCRVPDMVLGDLHAIVGTHRIGIQRIREFLDDYGMTDMDDLASEILSRSERALRASIRELPDGRSHYSVTADGYLEPFTLNVELTIKDDEIHLDFEGTSPQQWHSAINAAFNISYATAVYPIKAMLAPYIFNNDGLIRPVKMTAPEGSIVNCTFPAPVAARAKVIKHIPPLIFGAMAELMPESVIAAAGGIFPFHIVGHDDRHGRHAVHVLPHGGLGATHNADGLLPRAYPHNSTVTPTEMFEIQCPVLMTHKRLIPDSGGPGTHRGGLGQEIGLRALTEQGTTLTIRPDLMKYPAEGLRGGHRGTPGDVIMNGERMERFVPYQFKSGDEVVLRVPGGGGHGPPNERTREDVLEDVSLGLVSPAQASEAYGVQVEGSQEDLEAQSMKQAIAQVRASSHGDHS
ncbi:MAG: hydantoinase B/oxoprolinase family protein [Caldilineaceae bacterium SB0664_bin_22]|nr:hydantoinase B/oxoprolinase family protein [Caldilineaceae bacterium SB0664_bin_22]MYC61482.1 hydantoinase B/oxoprolinase family protein [Caldilineaceae bacterium SB0661_bin_34]